MYNKVKLLTKVWFILMHLHFAKNHNSLPTAYTNLRIRAKFLVGSVFNIRKLLMLQNEGDMY